MKIITLLFLQILFYFQVLSQNFDSTIALREIDSLIGQNRLFTAKIKYDEAIQVIALAEKKALLQLGGNHPKYALALFNHGRTQYLFGHLKEAEQLYLEALKIQSTIQGKDKSDYGWTLNNLGGLYWKLGNYREGEKYYIQAIEVRREVLGEQHPDYAWSLHNLGILYVDMGYYEKAEQLYKKAKGIRERNPGPQSTDYGYSLNHLAILYRLLGDYKLSEEGHLKALEVFTKIRGKDHPDVAWVQGNLYTLYDYLGNYTKAETCAKEVVRIREKLFGRHHADFAQALISLADIQIRKGNYKEAESSYLEAKSVLEQIYGTHHIQQVRNYWNLAELYQTMEDVERAEAFWLKAFSLCDSLKENNPSEYIYSVMNLGEFYLDQNKTDKAEYFFNDAEKQIHILFGSQHPRYARCLEGLAEVKLRQKDFYDASQLASKASEIYKNQLSKSRLHLSEYELGLFLNHFLYKLDKDYYLAMQYPAFADVAMDNTLFYKAFLLQNSQMVYRKYQKDSLGLGLLNELKSYRRRLGKEYEKPLKDQEEVSQIEDKVNQIEKELAKRVYQGGIEKEFVTRKQLIAKLGTEEAAVEFIHFNANPSGLSDSIVYAALITKHNQEHSEFITLCGERELTGIINVYGDKRLDYVNSIYTYAGRGVISATTARKNLKELVIDPMVKSLAGVKTIYFSATGILHRINLDAIPMDESQTLADRYTLIGLNSTRQLVFSQDSSSYEQTAVLYGGIQFEKDTLHTSNEQSFASRSQGTLPFERPDIKMRGGVWSYLPGTEREANTIQKIMEASGIKAEVVKGIDATEESFKQLGKEKAAPRILHIATHGYFFPDPERTVDTQKSMQDDSTSSAAKDPTLANTTIASGSIPNVSIKEGEPVFKISEHPMLRSGLILAGGNEAWQGKPLPEWREDGILTAYEISQMDLSKTELVVLSACETGLGDIQGNEGVYGLQRAFKIAGVKYIIMSLWQVPDKQTSLLMTTFYKKWLGTGDPDKGGNKMTIPEAFHAAQKELREIGLDPYQWAGFILVR